MNEKREELIKKWTKKLLAKLEEILPNHPNEDTFRGGIDPLLDEFLDEIDIHPISHKEFTLANGRADTVFNRLIVEYKAPGALKESMDKGTKDAINQIEGYLESLSQKEYRKLHRLAGTIFDGYFIIFVRFINAKFVDEPIVKADKNSIERFLTWLSGLSSGIALTADNLKNDFSIEQSRTKNILKALFSAVNTALEDDESMVLKLFDQWKLFFSESVDYSEAFGGDKLDKLKKWVKKSGININTPIEAERFFFALHTYFALLVKFLGWLAVSKHMAVKIGAPSFYELSTLDGDSLKAKLRDLENGGVFRAYGILNLLEGDFFEWYLYSWDEKIENALHDLLKRLDEYDPATLREIPEETRDLFKKLYHYLLPKEIRHNLGEYYTPDWIAQRLLKQVDYWFFNTKSTKAKPDFIRKLMTTRWLDPACGSGTFLVRIITRILTVGQELFIPEHELLEAILENVKGIDLNPLAVLTARVNYLLVIEGLIEHRKHDIEIPIYLADSVKTPAIGEDLFSDEAYEFPTAIGKFRVPILLCKSGVFNKFCEILEQSVDSEINTEIFLRKIAKECNISPDNWNTKIENKLSELYENILSYHKKGMNGLWARLLKNNFAPLTMGEFNYIVGNPPWINWENLPDTYRDSIKPIWEKYGLFPHSGMDQILGKGKKDISMLMTYVVADRLLQEKGKLGFVLPQTLLKNVGAAQGFRKFFIPSKLGEGTPVHVIHVDDLSSLNPFENTSNQTTVLILEKGNPTTYPVPYTIWRKDRSTKVDFSSDYDDIFKSLEHLNYFAEPVNPADTTSAWLTAKRNAHQIIRKSLGRSTYIAHAGVYSGGLNAAYWVEIINTKPDGHIVIRNIIEGSKKKVQQVISNVEPDLIYPLLRDKDLKKWHATPTAYILMVQDPIKRMGIEEKIMQEKYSETYDYLFQFKVPLLNRKSRGLSDMIASGAPFYTMFSVGEYSFSPWKVVWSRISRVEAAVIHIIDDKPIMPQETITTIECGSSEEAYYLSALINSTIFQYSLLSFSHTGKSMGTPSIIENIYLPSFNGENIIHNNLAQLAKQASLASIQNDLNKITKIENDIDNVASALWGISETELKEIIINLEELKNCEPEGIVENNNNTDIES